MSGMLKFLMTYDDAASDENPRAEGFYGNILNVLTTAGSTITLLLC
jgi:hypothetical protein